MRKRKKKRIPGLLVTHCHTEDSKKRSLRVLPEDELLKRDASGFPSIQLKRGDRRIHLAGFVSRRHRDTALISLRLARLRGEKRFRMPTSGLPCPCCGNDDQTALYPTSGNLVKT